MHFQRLSFGGFSCESSHFEPGHFETGRSCHIEDEVLGGLRRGLADLSTLQRIWLPAFMALLSLAWMTARVRGKVALFVSIFRRVQNSYSFGADLRKISSCTLCELCKNRAEKHRGSEECGPWVGAHNKCHRAQSLPKAFLIQLLFLTLVEY